VTEPKGGGVRDLQHQVLGIRAVRYWPSRCLRQWQDSWPGSTSYLGTQLGIQDPDLGNRSRGNGDAFASLRLGLRLERKWFSVCNTGAGSTWLGDTNALPVYS